MSTLVTYVNMTGKYENILKGLLKRSLFTSKDARHAGLPSRMLAYYCSKGLIRRIGRGIYQSVDFDSKANVDLEDLALTAASIPNGVICLISALYYYDLTDQIMREYWIAIPNKNRAPKRPHVRIVRMRNIALGQEEITIGKYTVKIFDRERTIIDAFRYLSLEIAIKAIKTYFSHATEYKPNLRKLEKYAQILKVDIGPYILAYTT